jgi:aspartokinase-like uncharacterized kinase
VYSKVVMRRVGDDVPLAVLEHMVTAIGESLAVSVQRKAQGQQLAPLLQDDAAVVARRQRLERSLLNLTADTVAAAIGAALGAEKLVLCTGAPGILADINDPTSVVSYTDLAGLAKLRSEGRINDGMLPKAKAIENAIQGGVQRVHVISYKAPDAILAEVFTNEGTGTLVVADIGKLAPAELAAGNAQS